MSENGFRGLRIYNTLTRTKQDFVPLDAQNVRMYVCGPTVYDFAHIGNARPVIVFDVMFRLLRHLYGAEHVTYARNITDVDDKINARALRDFGEDIAAGRLSLNEAIRKVTETTANQFHADVKALGCLKPSIEPRATEHIDGMVTMIQELLEKDHAYLADGSEGREVLFDTASMPDYGRLSRRRLEDQQAGARVAVEEHKKNPADFVLWKESSAKEPGWEANFAAHGQTFAIRGRPGWHIECSVMSGQHLGDVFDIHGGGLDLIFPHHENELAQSRCAHGTDVMARYWMHNGFLQVEGQKMSKSLGNFVTIHDLLETERFGGRQWPGEVLRLAMLMTHYREPIDFSVRKLEEAKAILERWADALEASEAEVASGPDSELSPNNPLLDDLNTPAFIQELHPIARQAAAGDGHAKTLLRLGLDLVGFERIGSFSRSAQAEALGADGDMTARIAAAIDKRLAFIREKNWGEADRIRDELAGEGIQLKDGKDAETGERVTTWEVKR
ncbi:cysteine--tRNA ligase [Mesorhizobium xinjiangense]|uniref:cysteine--tRNA ligase n=1 Tax=Mesorhizobium xinjiangense TaxID=2678685 RepID=UPI0012ED957C|nr:cysteine--tRNA ligase [Mesorhizobium xinjiangense]